MSNYLPLIVRHALINTGWLDNEVTVYSLLLEKGKMNISALSDYTSIPVSSLQHTIKKLLAKRMIRKTFVNMKPIYIAKEPKQLETWIRNCSSKLSEFESTIHHFIEQYDFHPDVATPKARQFEGKKGVKDSYLQILDLCRSKEISSFFSTPPNLDQDLKEFIINEYITGRKERQIKNKNIGMNADIAIEYAENPEKYANETQVVHQYFPIAKELQNTEINIFDEYVHYMTFDQSKSFGLIIEDKGLSSLLKLLFQLLWQLNTKITLYNEKNLPDSYKDLFSSKGDKQVLTISNITPSESPKIKNLLEIKAKIIQEKELEAGEIRPNIGNSKIEITIYGSTIHILTLDQEDIPQLYILHDTNLAAILRLINSSN